MDHAENLHTTNPSGVTLTRKGERAVHQQAMARSLAIAEKKRIRLEAGEEIERLMTILDRLDGDPDLEPSGDEDDDDRQEEFSLGWAGHMNQTSRHRMGELDTHFGDRELDRADDEDGGDLEPSLAIHAALGWFDYDAEDDPCDRGEADQCEDAMASGVSL